MRSTGHAVVAYAILCCASCGHEPSQAPVLALDLLADGDVKQRLRAIDELSKQNVPLAMTMILDALDDDEELVSAHACAVIRGLSFGAIAEASRLLEVAIGRGAPGISGIRSMAEEEQEAYGRLFEGLQAESVSSRLSALLGEIVSGVREPHPNLAAYEFMLLDEDPEVRHLARVLLVLRCVAATYVRSEVCVPAAEDTLDWPAIDRLALSSDPIRRQCGSAILACYGPSGARLLDELAEHLMEVRVGHAMLAANRMSELTVRLGSRSRDLIREAMQFGYESVAVGAAECFVRNSPANDIEAVVESTRPQEGLATAVALAARRMPSTGARRLLRAVILHGGPAGSSEWRIRAIRAWGLLGEDSAQTTAALVELMRSTTSPDVRVVCAVALARLSSGQRELAMSVLLEGFRDAFVGSLVLAEIEGLGSRIAPLRSVVVDMLRRPSGRGASTMMLASRVLKGSGVLAADISAAVESRLATVTGAGAEARLRLFKGDHKRVRGQLLEEKGPILIYEADGDIVHAALRVLVEWNSVSAQLRGRILGWAHSPDARVRYWAKCALRRLK